MKKINICLVTGNNELLADKKELSNFIRDLNDKYEDLGIYFKVMTNEDKLPINEENIKKSELFLVLLGTHIDNEILQEFEIAYQEFKNQKFPKIATYIKNTNNLKDQDLMLFMKHLDQELGHYYNIYENIDTIKLNMILQLKTLGLKQGKIEIKNEKLFVGKKEIITLEKIPMIYNNKILAEYKRKYQKINENYWKLKDELYQNSDDDNILNQYEKARKDKKDIEEKIYKLENDLLYLQSQFIDVCTDEKVSKRQIYAKECLDAGNLEEAKKILDFREIKEDGDKLVKLQSKSMKNAEILLKDFWQRIEILKQDANSPGRIEDIKKVFEEAVSLEQKTCKGRDTLCKYAEFLFEIKEYENAIKYAKRYEAYLTIENKIENREKVKEIIEKSLKKINKR